MTPKGHTMIFLGVYECHARFLSNLRDQRIQNSPILRYVRVHVRMATRNAGLRPFNKVLLWLVRVLLAIQSIMYTLLSCESCGLVF